MRTTRIEWKTGRKRIQYLINLVIKQNEKTIFDEIILIYSCCSSRILVHKCLCVLKQNFPLRCSWGWRELISFHNEMNLRWFIPTITTTKNERLLVHIQFLLLQHVTIYRRKVIDFACLICSDSSVLWKWVYYKIHIINNKVNSPRYG